MSGYYDYFLGGDDTTSTVPSTPPAITSPQPSTFYGNTSYSAITQGYTFTGSIGQPFTTSAITWSINNTTYGNINPSSGVLTLTFPLKSTANASLTVTATNSNGSASQTFQVIVTNTAQPQITNPPGTLTGSTVNSPFNWSYQFNGNIGSPGTDNLVWSSTMGSINSSTGYLSVSFPQGTSSGSFNVAATNSNGTASTTVNYNFTSSIPPTITSPQPLNINENSSAGSNIVLNYSFTANVGAPSTSPVIWSISPTTYGNINSSSGALTLTFLAGQVASGSFTVMATNSNGSASQSWTYNITTTNNNVISDSFWALGTDNKIYNTNSGGVRIPQTLVVSGNVTANNIVYSVNGRKGDVSFTSSDVTNALGYLPSRTWWTADTENNIINTNTAAVIVNNSVGCDELILGFKDTSSNTTNGKLLKITSIVAGGGGGGAGGAGGAGGGGSSSGGYINYNGKQYNYIELIDKDGKIPWGQLKNVPDSINNISSTSSTAAAGAALGAIGTALGLFTATNSFLGGSLTNWIKNTFGGGGGSPAAPGFDGNGESVRDSNNEYDFDYRFLKNRDFVGTNAKFGSHADVYWADDRKMYIIPNDNFFRTESRNNVQCVTGGAVEIIDFGNVWFYGNKFIAGNWQFTNTGIYYNGNNVLSPTGQSSTSATSSQNISNVADGRFAGVVTNVAGGARRALQKILRNRASVYTTN
jgi:hypothetical protein